VTEGVKEFLSLEMSEEDGELCPLHMEAAPIELVVNGGECIWDVVKLAGELGLLILEVAIPIYLGNCGWVVEVMGLLDEGVEISIVSCEDGEEPQSCCLSIVRPEEKLCDIGGFPRLLPSQ
jgi:hypothetical protein